MTTTICFLSARSMPTIAFVTGTRIRNRASRALRPGSHLDFAPNDEAARSAGARIIAVDRPGVGGSDFRAGRRLRDWPDDIAALVDALGIERFAVLGFSFGGPYALAVAHALGSRVRAMGPVSAMGPFDRPRATERMMPPTRLMFALALTAGWLARPAVAGMTRSIARGPDRFITQMYRSVAAPDRAVLEARPDAPRRSPTPLWPCAEPAPARS